MSINFLKLILSSFCHSWTSYLAHLGVRPQLSGERYELLDGVSDGLREAAFAAEVSAGDDAEDAVDGGLACGLGTEN